MKHGCLFLTVIFSFTAPAWAQDNSTALETLINQYVESQYSGERADPVFVPDAPQRAIAEKAGLLEALRGIGSEGLSREQLTDRTYLLGVLESDIHTARAQQRWATDPSMYLPARQIGLLTDPDHASPATDLAADLLSQLAELPDRLATARDKLVQPSERFTREAMFQARQSHDSLVQSQERFGQTEAAKSIAESISLLESYVQFLESDLLPRSTGSWVFGRQNYDFILNTRWHMSDDAATILQRGLDAFEETEAMASEVAARIEPGVHWTEVYEKLKDNHPDAAGLKQAYQVEMDRAQVFVLENNLVTLPEGERVITIDTPPAMRRSSPFGTFQSVSPFNDSLEGRLVLTPVETWMSAEQQQSRLRSHHLAWTPVIAVHEAYPGHHVHAIKLRENPRLLRRVAREPIFTEGWGLFTEELMFELGFLQGDEIRLTQLRNRLWRAARVILDASLHTGQMSFEEAVDFLVDKVRFERYSAELEVGMYIRRPTYVLGYLIGMQALQEIRSDWIGKYGEPQPPSKFYDALLSVGSLPPSLMREELLAADPH